MKKLLVLVCILILSLTILLSGCSSKSEDSVQGSTAGYDNDESGYNSAYDKSSGDYAPAEEPGEAGSSSGTGDAVGTEAADFAEKMIYTAWVEVETLDFDGALETLEKRIEANGAFLQSSSVSGNSYYESYYSSTSSRYAHYVIRVPADRYDAMVEDMEALGYVRQSSEDAQNITAQYSDAESRLNAYRTEEDRLLELLKKAETVVDIITIETRLSEVRYQIESLESTLRNYDNQVDYSTINLSVYEVAEIHETQSVQRTYGERIADAFKDSIDWVVRAAKNIGVFVVAAVPVLVIPAVILVVVFVILHNQAKKRRKENEKNASGQTQTGEPSDPNKK